VGERSREEPQFVRATLFRVLGAIRAEIDKRDRAVLDAVRVPLTIAPLLIAVFASAEWQAGRASFLLVLHVFSSLAMVAALWGKKSPIWLRRWILCGAVTLSAGCAVLHYGPLFGAGVYFIAATLAASFFLGARGGVATITALLGFLALTAWGSRAGWLSPVYAVSTWLAWARLEVGAAFLLGASGYLFHRVQRLSRDSLLAQLQAQTEQEKAEGDRERLLQQSMTAQRLEGIGRLAGGVAHDFNNALSVVLSNADLLQGSKALTEDDRALLADVLGAARRAHGTCNALLAFARSRPEDVGACAPDHVLERFARSFGRLLVESIHIEVQARAAPAVPLAESALEQVLMNLALNSRDAMPKGGVLRLACRADEKTGGSEIEVVDDGVGMSDDVRSRIFEPFFTTRERGTGLGLSMVWGMVTRVGGVVQVESRPGGGTRFVLSFPPAAAPQQEEAHPTPLRRGGRVLLLEDDPQVLLAFTRVLQRGGYEVSAFERAALAEQAAASGDFAALVTDAIVPGGGVVELMAAFRRANPRSPILVCSGHVEEELITHGIARGDYRFLRKPVEIDALLAAVAGLPTEPARAAAE
jgi:signal transduction histidine kinase/CheY-like chemotaxis protein